MIAWFALFFLLALFAYIHMSNSISPASLLFCLETIIRTSAIMETNESCDSNGLHQDQEESMNDHQLDQSNATHDGNASIDRNGHAAESQDEYAAAASLMKLGGAEDKDVGSQEASASSSPMAPQEMFRGTYDTQENQQPASASQLEDAKAVPMKREDESTPNSDEESSRTRPRRKRQRVLDLSRNVEPTDYDVLFGRGGGTNSHPGNCTFRAKALELRDQYEYDNQSKPEKERTARELVQFVLEHGRFIEKGQDMLWHVVVSGYHTKASQQLREARRGTD